MKADPDVAWLLEKPALNIWSVPFLDNLGCLIY
jgi:hypothetical protein